MTKTKRHRWTNRYDGSGQCDTCALRYRTSERKKRSGSGTVSFMEYLVDGAWVEMQSAPKCSKSKAAISKMSDTEFLAKFGPSRTRLGTGSDFSYDGDEVVSAIDAELVLALTKALDPLRAGLSRAARGEQWDGLNIYATKVQAQAILRALKRIPR